MFSSVFFLKKFCLPLAFFHNAVISTKEPFQQKEARMKRSKIFLILLLGGFVSAGAFARPPGPPPGGPGGPGGPPPRHHGDKGVALAADIVNLVGASLNVLAPRPAPPPPPPPRPMPPPPRPMPPPPRPMPPPPRPMPPPPRPMPPPPRPMPPPPRPMPPPPRPMPPPPRPMPPPPPPRW